MTKTWLLDPATSEDDQRRVAAALLARGLTAGDRVAFALGNSPLLLSAVIGAMRVGIVPVLLNATLLAPELDALIADARPALTVRTARALHALAGDSRADLAPVPLCRPMHYTSGTSGTPKGVWPGVLGPEDAAAMHAEEAAVWGLEAADIHLTCSPLYHSVGIRFSTQALLRGAPVVLLEKFDAPAVASAIARHGVRSLFMVPTHLHRFLGMGSLPPLGRVRLLAHAGAACPPALKRKAMEAFPSVWEFYGATEGQFTVCPPEDWLAHPGTVGRARPGRTLSIDDRGQIWCAVPPFAHFSYWGDPAKTEAAWRGASFTVGDLGRLDDDGFLFLDGRRDDLIISGGMNVYPAEVEHALGTVEGVEEIAVFGLPDPDWGQRVCAAVVGSVQPAAVLARAAEVLAGYKRPKEIHLVADLPRTGTGKIKRGAVASWLGLASPDG